MGGDLVHFTQPAAVYLDDIWNLRISDVILLGLADLISETSGLSGDVCDGDGGVCVGGTASVQKDQEDSHGCGTEKCGVREL